MPVQKSLETYWRHQVYMYIYLYHLNSILNLMLIKIVQDNTRGSQKFCYILVVHKAKFYCSAHFCRSRESEKTYWVVSCRTRLILSKSYSSDLEHGLGIRGFWPTCPCLIIKILETGTKFLQPFTYSTVINCIFTFRTTNIFGCVMAAFEHVKYKFLN